MAAIAVNEINSAGIMTFLPEYMSEQKGLDRTWVCVMRTMQAGFGVAFSLLAPSMIRRFSNPSILSTGLCITCSGSLMIGVVGPNVPGLAFGVNLVAIRAFQGCGDGLTQVAAIATILRVAPERDVALYTGLCEGMRALAGLLGPMLGGAVYQMGGFTLPFLVVAGLQALIPFALALLNHFYPHACNQGRVAKVEGRELLMHPPSKALLLVVLIACLPLALVEQSAEEYLSSAPYWSDPHVIGAILGAAAFAALLGTLVAGPSVVLLGALPTLFLAWTISFVGQAMLACTPETLAWFVASLCMLSYSFLPILVVLYALLLRVARTYGLEAKEYAEVIASALMAAVMGAMCLGALMGPLIVGAMGFRRAQSITGCLALLSPLVLVRGLHPSCIGQPLAPPADDLTEAAEEKKKQARLKGMAVPPGSRRDERTGAV